jgi:DNA-binding MarR family transcriptional regulator
MAKEIDFKFNSPENSPGYLLGQLTMLWQRRIKKCLEPLDLTQTQFVLLAAVGWLSKKSDSVTQIDIANQSNADRMMVSKVLRTLQEKGFITRKEHETDTRAKTIALTDAGASVLQKALIEVENADLRFFGLLSDGLPAFNAYMSSLVTAHAD